MKLNNEITGLETLSIPAIKEKNIYSGLNEFDPF